MAITAYPLTWPQALERTPAKQREKGLFKTTLPGALKNVNGSLHLFATDSKKSISEITISSNVTLGAERPTDPGVAVWFTWDGLGVCIAVDRYGSIEANLQAIHHIIEARRVELRHGSLAMVRATWQGLVMLPAPAAENWYDVLAVDPSAQSDTIAYCYKVLRAKHHPDKGGDAVEFDRIEKAWATFQRECGE